MQRPNGKLLPIQGMFLLQWQSLQQFYTSTIFSGCGRHQVICFVSIVMLEVKQLLSQFSKIYRAPMRLLASLAFFSRNCFDFKTKATLEEQLVYWAGRYFASQHLHWTASR